MSAPHPDFSTESCCGNCGAWGGEKLSDGYEEEDLPRQCRRSPPTLMSSTGEDGDAFEIESCFFRTGFPVTGTTDWCAEWIPARKAKGNDD